MRDSRRCKGLFYDLTIEVEGLALFKAIAPKRLDYFVDTFPYMVHEKYLDAICKDVDYEVMSRRLLY